VYKTQSLVYTILMIERTLTLTEENKMSEKVNWLGIKVTNHEIEIDGKKWIVQSSPEQSANFNGTVISGLSFGSLSRFGGIAYIAYTDDPNCCQYHQLQVTYDEIIELARAGKYGMKIENN
jgi:predicted NAD/FAD-dependent oxidoreductase